MKQSLGRFNQKGTFSDIRKITVSTMDQYHMILPHEKILVAVSGGKDSTLLALILKDIQKRAPFPFELEFILIDQKNPNTSYENYLRWMKEKEISVTVIEEDTWSIVQEKRGHKSPCSLCARFRRGILYTYAQKNGFHKIALGHHRDDATTTFLMNFLYGGMIGSMPPKLCSHDKQNIVIRPFYFIPEKWLVNLNEYLKIPTQTCTSCEEIKPSMRKKLKKILWDIEEENPEIAQSMISALQNINPSTLADQNFFNFEFESRKNSTKSLDSYKKV